MLHYLHLVCECQFCERTAVLRPVAVAGAILVVVAPAFCTMLVTSVSAKLILPNTFEEKRMLNHKPEALHPTVSQRKSALCASNCVDLH